MPGIVVAQDEWSPKPGVAQDRFYCILINLLHTIHYSAPPKLRQMPPKRYWAEDRSEPSSFFVYVSKCRRRHLVLSCRAYATFFIESSLLCHIDSPPAFGTVDTGKGWHSQVCPRAIGGISTCHKMIHSLSLPTVTYICMRALPHFHHGTTTSFLHSQPIQTPPSGPGLICAAGQVFVWDDPSVMPLS